MSVLAGPVEMREAVTATAANSTAADAVSTPDVCFICLEEATADKPLTSPCKCPRRVHAKCMATWQLHRAGNREERECRFCFSTLPPPLEAWKVDASAIQEPQTVMAAVVFNNVVYRIPIKPGPEGRAEFKATVKQLFGLSNNFDCTFDTRIPNSNDKVSLRGLDAYEAATRCAALSAGQASTSAPTTTSATTTISATITTSATTTAATSAGSA